MELEIAPTRSLNGEIIAPGSKSYSHRAFIAASLSKGVSIIKNPLTSGDVETTMNVLKALGVKILQESKNSYIVERSETAFTPTKQVIDCKNSGTTIRIFTALSLLVDGGLSLKGEFLKRSRPIIPLLDALKALGGEYTISPEKLHIQRTSQTCNTVKIQGDISSQFITALLFTSPLLKCENTNYVEIEITTPLMSYPYIQITLDVLNKFGINVQEKLNKDKRGKYLITSGQEYRPHLYEIPGDFSSATFMIGATVLAPEDSKVKIKNLDINNPQGDKKVIEILREMGAKIEINQKKHEIVVYGNRNKYPLKGVEVDCGDIPDSFPILSVIGAFARGKMVLYNAANLRIKESDRIAMMAKELGKMGVKVEEERDKLTIYHCDKLKGSNIEHKDDHRIAMACCVAALYAESNSTIHRIEVVQDSYTTFVEDLKNLGGNIK